MVPFLTRQISLTVPEAIQKAYFLSSTATSDFEQYCRELFVIVLAAVLLLWFGIERMTLRPAREIPRSRMTAVLFGGMGLYLILGLVSALLSDYPGVVWLGSYQLYEGYLALAAYGVIFAAAWYWCDRKEVLQFVYRSLTILGIAIGILALLERLGYCYYNFALIQWLSNLNGTVGKPDGAVLTFGNADYLGVFCALLLPVLVSRIRQSDSTIWMLLQILSAVLIGTTLILTKVSTAIVIGYGVTLALLLVWLCHNSWERVRKVMAVSICAVVVLVSSFGYLMTRTGDTMGEKVTHLATGMDIQKTFQLLEIGTDGNTVSMENADTVFAVTASSSQLSADTLTFTCNGTEVTAQENTDGLLTFAESALQNCQVQVAEDHLEFLLGYPTPVQAYYTGESWQIVTLGGGLIDTVPQVSTSRTLQQMYPYLNGRIFVWANTISALSDCWIVGHGAGTTIFYLNQEDLPALLNIFGQYTLFNKPHCWYLQMAQDTGILSAVCMIAMLVAFLIVGGKTAFRRGTNWNPEKAGLWFAVLGYSLLMVFHDSQIYFAPVFWLIFGMGVRQLMAASKEE